jgi:hypothetical protein
MIGVQEENAGEVSGERHFIVEITILKRLYQMARKLGTFSYSQIDCNDKTLQALLTIYDLQKTVQQAVEKQFKQRLLHQYILRAPDGVSVEDDPFVSRLQKEIGDSGHPLIAQEDVSAEEDLELLSPVEDNWEKLASPEELAEYERYDQMFAMLLDLCEEHPYAIHLYFYERMAAQLTPFAEQFETGTAIETLQALITAYQTNNETLQKFIAAYQTQQASTETLQALITAYQTSNKIE